jgi:hypothetical protein
LATTTGADAGTLMRGTCILDIAANDQNIVAAEFNQVEIAPWQEGVARLAASSQQAYSVTLLGDQVYWASNYATLIARNPIDAVGCPPCETFDVSAYVYDVAASTTDLVFILGPPFDNSEPESVRRLLADGGVSVIAANQPGAHSLAVTDSWVFWVASSAIRRARIDGTEVGSLIGESATSVAADDRALFWTVGGSDGAVRTSDFDAKEPRTLATQQNHPGSIAIDEGSIYWVNSGSGGSDGQVVKLSR